MPPKKQFIGGQIVQKEMQRAIAVYCWNQVFPLESWSKKEILEAKCKELYHGELNNDELMGIVKQFLNGMPPFNVMFKRALMNGEGTAHLELLSEYHQQDKTILVSDQPADRGITLQLLSYTGLTNNILLNGRVIRVMGKDVVTNANIALGIINDSKYQPYIASGTLPSSEEWEEYTRFLRIEMYKKQKKENGNNTNTNENTNSNDAEEEKNAEQKKKAEEENRKAAKYVWVGYFAFISMGPIVPKEQDINNRLEVFF